MATTPLIHESVRATLPSRDQIAAAIETMVAVLDCMDPDPDLDTANAEDEHLNGFATYGTSGPGCSIADAGEYAYPEWHTRGRHKAAEFRGTLPHEDAEEDDGPDSSGDEAEPDFATRHAGSGPGCLISDPDKGGEEDGEIEQGEYARHYGIDQTKPISEDNPAIA